MRKLIQYFDIEGNMHNLNSQYTQYSKEWIQLKDELAQQWVMDNKAFIVAHHSDIKGWIYAHSETVVKVELAAYIQSYAVPWWQERGYTATFNNKHKMALVPVGHKDTKNH